MSKEETKALEDQEWIEVDVDPEVIVKDVPLPNEPLAWGRDGTGRLVRVSVDE